MNRSLQAALRHHAGRHAAPKPRVAAKFWEDFRARAAMTPQALPAAPARRGVPAWAWAAVSAVAAIVVGVSVWRGALPPPLSPAVLSVSAGENRSLFILRDDSTAAVIVWVAEESSRDNGGQFP